MLVENVQRSKHDCDDKKLEYEKCDSVDHVYSNPELLAAAVLRSTTTDHALYVFDEFECSKKRAIHPSTPLFHEINHTFWSVRGSFCIRYVFKCVSLICMNVDMKTHYAIFS